MGTKLSKNRLCKRASRGTFRIGRHLFVAITFGCFGSLPAGNVQPEYIFYSNATHISYVTVDGGEAKAFIEVEGATLGYDQLTYRLWYHDKPSVTLYNINLDASDAQTVSVPSSFDAFTVDAENKIIYYLNKDDRSVKSIDYSGNSLPDIPQLQGNNEFTDLQIDASNR